jgi:hypothetical protein
MPSSNTPNNSIKSIEVNAVNIIKIGMNKEKEVTFDDQEIIEKTIVGNLGQTGGSANTILTKKIRASYYSSDE